MHINKIKIILPMFIFLFFMYKSAYANVPIGAAFVMAFPLVSMFVSWGLALLAAILIEGLFLKRMLNLNYLAAYKISILANAFSTLIGVGIAIAYSSSFAFLICWIPGAILLKRLFRYLAEKIGYLENFAKRRFLSFIAFLGIGFLGMILGGLLLPWSHFGSALYRGKVPAPNFFLIIPAFAMLLILGFLITLITEGAIVARFFPQKQRNILRAVAMMNLFSYLAILLATGISILNIIFKI
jgi:hypothetical protein